MTPPTGPSVDDDPHGALVRRVSRPAAAAMRGHLAGYDFVVKDNVDVAGLPTGNGHPGYAEWRGIPRWNATVVDALTDAGATCVGKAHMHELAYGLTGVNPHLGTPDNPLRAGAIPGGSSSGSAVAVAAGMVDFALGTDTGGSVRVPAAFCGLFGYRPTYGAIPVDGTVYLGESFDTVGVLAPTAEVLAEAARVLLPAETPSSAARPASALVLEGAFEHAGDAATDAVRSVARRLEATGVTLRAHHEGTVLEEARRAQTVLQGVEAYAYHEAWLERAQPDLGPDVRRLLDTASARTSSELREAKATREAVHRAAATMWDAHDLLLLPTVPHGPPRLAELRDDDEALRFRLSLLNLTNFASLIGAPVVSVPVRGDQDEILGVQIIAAPGRDAALLDLVRGLWPTSA